MLYFGDCKFFLEKFYLEKSVEILSKFNILGIFLQFFANFQKKNRKMEQES